MERSEALYYARLGLGGKLEQFCEAQLKSRGFDATLSILKCLGLAREGNFAGALRDAEALRSQRPRECELASYVLCAHLQRRAKLADAHMAAQLDAAASDALDKASVQSMVLAGNVAFIIGDADFARLAADKACAKAEGSGGVGEVEASAYLLKGWVETCAGMTIGLGPVGSPSLSTNRSASKRELDSAYNAQKYFDKSTSMIKESTGGKSMDPDCVLGIVKFFERRGGNANVENALSALADLRAYAPEFAPAMLESSRLYARMSQWGMCMELANSAIEADPNNVEAHRLIVLATLVCEGSGKKAVARVGDLASSILRVEGKNAPYLSTVARSVARLCGGNKTLLNITLGIAEAACKVDPDVAAYPVEVGRQRLACGDSSGAQSAFKDAAAADEVCADAIAGLILCLLAENNVDDAEQQLELFRVVAEGAGDKPPSVAVLDAKVVARKRNAGPKERMLSLQALVEAEELYEQSIKRLFGEVEYEKLVSNATTSSAAAASTGAGDGFDDSEANNNNNNDSFSRQRGGGGGNITIPTVPLGAADIFEFYAAIDPDLLMEIASEYVVLPSSSSSSSLSSVSHSRGGRSTAVAGRDREGNTSSSSSGLLASLLSIELYDDARSTNSISVKHALSSIARVTATVPASLPAWLLSAAIYSSCADYDSAISSASRVLSIDRSYVDAHLLLAQISLKKKDPRVALSSLESALSYSFSIQETSHFQRLRSAALLLSGRVEEAVIAAETAMRLPGIRLLSTETSSSASSSQMGNTASSSSSSSSSSSFGNAGAGGRRRGGGAEASATAASASANVNRGIPTSERAAVFIQCIDCYSAAKRFELGKNLLQESMTEFGGSSEEARITLASARLSLLEGDVDAALAQLKTIRSDSPSFVEALSLRAETYLKHRRDRVRYIKCFEELHAISHKLGRDAHIAQKELGDAHMRVGDPESAISAYQSGLKDRPNEIDLVRALGRALVSTHDYQRAVSYLKTSMQNAASDSSSSSSFSSSSAKSSFITSLRNDLIELLVKLGQHDDAQHLINEVISSTNSKGSNNGGSGGQGGGDVVSLISARNNLELLAKVKRSANAASDAVNYANEALTVQNRILTILRGGGGGDDGGGGGGGASASASSSPTTLSAEKDEAARLHVFAGTLCEQCLPPRDDDARGHYIDALKLADNFGPANVALAKLQMKRGELEECRATCTVISQSAQNADYGGLQRGGGGGNIALMVNSEAIDFAEVTLADLDFRANDTTSAIFHFSQVLQRSPTDFQSMRLLLGLLRRSGKVKEIEKFLRLAIKKSPSSALDPGYKLVKGMLLRFSNEPHESITCLNACRTSPEWCASAVEQMVHIYLSSYNEPLWIDRDTKASTTASNSSSSSSSSSAQNKQQQAQAQQEALSLFNENLTIAQSLLDSVPKNLRHSSRHEVLNCYVLMSGLRNASSLTSADLKKSNASCDQAVSRLAAILDSDPDNIGALLALATAFMLQKQTPKARSQLKRLLKLPLDSTQADAFVNGWLMLADTVDAGKPEQAFDALQRALDLDASCGRAHEFLGGLFEREKKWDEAASSYSKAWMFDFEKSATVGYKLCFALIRVKKLVPAIDVANKVLTVFPNYSAIADLRSKARGELRP